MESYLPIAFLNDFVFCPRSIYFHQLYGKYNPQLYKEKPQIEGAIAHETIDEQRYSSRIDILQGIDVFSESYGLCGKIDTFFIQTGKLRERKKSIVRVYDGYIYQLYGQYVCLIEMGYVVSSIELYAMDQNKVYPIPLPENDPIQWQGFLDLLNEISQFHPKATFNPNPEKCKRCIYSNLCDMNAYVEFT